MAHKILNGSIPAQVVIGNALNAQGGYFIGFSALDAILVADGGRHPTLMMGAKFSTHEKGDTAGPRSPDALVRVTLLACGGPWRMKLWKQSQQDGVELLLTESGDYVAWEPGISHEWHAAGSATMFTVSLVRCGAT